MHAAKLESSARLQRVLACLIDGSDWSTMQIARQANVCAVNSCVAELREAGAKIKCWQVVKRAPDGTNRRVFFYRLIAPPGPES